ncbi:hypothetical protein [Desulfosporosinus shakirovi]|nr:hypothetical protein [Desulfosporosinus sp. SRJS8]MCB8818172.1 hypothetical protein [Desulfosporosinus sp. SRJS8]
MPIDLIRSFIPVAVTAGVRAATQSSFDGLQGRVSPLLIPMAPLWNRFK